MVLPILLWGDPKLRDMSKEVTSDINFLDKLISEMFETMHKAKGISLSAIQVGYPLRIFVVELHLKDQGIDFRESFINPVVKKQFGAKKKRYEGCLSTPGVIPMIDRYEKVKLQYYDASWNQKTKVFKGSLAHIIQHEMEHLNGDIFLDSMSQIWRITHEPTIQKIINRDFENLAYLYK